MKYLKSLSEQESAQTVDVAIQEKINDFAAELIVLCQEQSMPYSEIVESLKEAMTYHTEPAKIEEGLFSKKDKKVELENEFKRYIKAWNSKGYKISKEEYEAELKKAEADKYEGKWGVDAKNKTIIYRSGDTIAWGVSTHGFGSGSSGH